MLQIGPVAVDPPVVLAPMAGVTNRAFRRLCRRHGGALLVSEMVNARALVEGSRRSAAMTAFDDDETTRSIQLYGTDPAVIADAVRIVIDRGADHVDLNFGCPVRKVTRHGGGAAVPARPRLLGAIVGAAVRAAGPVPVTIKMRVGLDDARPTHVVAGRIAASQGAAAVALHARTAAQMYSGAARWSAISELVDALAGTGVPVLGNGDIWSPAHARTMLTQTGCAGVVVGRACLGRPWFFAELSAFFRGQARPAAPTLGAVATTIVEHARLLAEHIDHTDHTDRADGGGERGERAATLAIRKHIGWYLTGYPVGGATRRALTACESLAELERALATLDPTVEVLPGEPDRPRGTRRGPAPVTIPAGWMDADAIAPPDSRLAELAVSGG